MEIGFNPNVSFSAAKPQDTNSIGSSPISENLQQKSDSIELKSKQLKGSAYGLLSGAAVLGGSWLFGALPRGFRKGGSLKDVCTHPLKNIGTKSKVVAALVTLAVGSYHIVAAKLKANQKTANVDHQLKTGHRPA